MTKSKNFLNRSGRANVYWVMTATTTDHAAFLAALPARDALVRVLRGDEDLFQDLVIRLWQRWCARPAVRDWHRYALIAAKRLHIDAARKRRGCVRTTPIEVADPTDDLDRTSPEMSQAHSDEWRLVRAAIESLDACDWLEVKCLLDPDCDRGAVAHAAGLTAAGLRSRIHRFPALLRRSIRRSNQGMTCPN